jgi:DNA-binding MarR family transcriptional regulator
MSSDRRKEVAEAVHSAAIRVLRIVRMEDTKAGIGPAQLSALSVLVFAGPRTLGELASAEQVKAPTMSRVVDALVKQKLVERVTSSEDRRSVRIAATAKGKKLLLAGRDRRVKALASRMEKFSSRELDVLGAAAEILSKI